MHCDRHPHRRSRTRRARSNHARGIPFRLRSCDGGARHGDRGGASASLHRPPRRPNVAQRAPMRSRACVPVTGAGSSRRRWLPGYRASAAPLPVVGRAAACAAGPVGDSDAVPRREHCRAADAGRGAVACCRHLANVRDRAGRVNRRAFRRERCRAVVGRCRVPVFHARLRARVRQGFFPARPVCGTNSSCARRNPALAHARVRQQAPGVRVRALDSPARFR